MASSVQTMFTVRPIGMTYDRFGHVTIKSFVSVSRLGVCFLLIGKVSSIKFKCIFFVAVLSDLL